VIPSTLLQVSPELFLIVAIAAIFLLAMVWVYTDAKKNSEHPAFLWAAVVFLAPLLGLVLYFVVGRNQKGGGPQSQGY